MTFGQLFLILGVIAIVLMIVNIAIVVRSDRRQKNRKADHQGDHILNTSYLHTGGAFHGSSTQKSWTVPKDPQKYAKAFVPSSEKRKTK